MQSRSQTGSGDPKTWILSGLGSSLTGWLTTDGYCFSLSLSFLICQMGMHNCPKPVTLKNFSPYLGLTSSPWLLFLQLPQHTHIRLQGRAPQRLACPRAPPPQPRLQPRADPNQHHLLAPSLGSSRLRSLDCQTLFRDYMRHQLFLPSLVCRIDL